AILVHFSTDYVFPGKSADRIIYPKGYPEDAARKPVNIYGESKLAGELELEKSDAEWLLIRVSWLCSPFGKNFVNTMIRLGSVKNKLSVVEDQIGSPTYTFDVVAKTRKLLGRGKRGTFHVSSEGAISWADFAEEIFHITEMNVEVERVPSSEYPTDAERPAFSLLSTEKIRTVGLSPREWKEGLKQLIELRGQ
ncbi:MAG: NAD(P)-dependent oxidoreductase, partial [Balneolaceae bacterium]|nr:NAD(P)-dependent oxidoreductase [Balneolaceae bacterium]